jgi:hypothetical protein
VIKILSFVTLRITINEVISRRKNMLLVRRTTQAPVTIHFYIFSRNCIIKNIRLYEVV